MKFQEIKAPDILKKRTIARMTENVTSSKKPVARWLPVTTFAVSVLLLSGILTYRGLTTLQIPENEQHFYTESESLAEQSRQTTDILKLEQTPKNETASNPIPYYQKPMEDNTSPEALERIRNSFLLQKPLADYKVSNAYNDYMENGTYLHPEVDLAAESGAEIHAVCEGTVTETGFDSMRGNYIVIDHGDGMVSVYGHCKEVRVSQGTSVTLDTVIGTVGKSGMATGSFLSLSITLDEVPVNPEALFE